MTPENTTDATNAPDTIVLVHGFWVIPRSWEKWVERYEGEGYRVLAPAYPGLRGRGRSAARGPLTHRGAERPRHYRAHRGHHRGARQAPDHHGPLVGRTAYADTARSRLRGSRRGHRLGSGRGYQGRPRLADPLDFSDRRSLAFGLNLVAVGNEIVVLT
jgi:hypothetical protein